MDQAGSHGSKTAIDNYVLTLRKKWNIEVIFQVPCLPYTNVLDLSVWCSLQSKVEKWQFGQRCDVDTLASTVRNVWTSAKLLHMLTKVFQRLHKVLVLVAQAKGKNDLVESKRGAKFKNLDLWIMPTDYIPSKPSLGRDSNSAMTNDRKADDTIDVVGDIGNREEEGEDDVMDDD